MDWQPIETAPKDGTPIWLIESGDDLGLTIPHQFQGCWHPDDRTMAGGWWMEVGDYVHVCFPHHWMPLPPAPLKEGGARHE